MRKVDASSLGRDRADQVERHAAEELGIVGLRRDDEVLLRLQPRADQVVDARGGRLPVPRLRLDRSGRSRRGEARERDQGGATCERGQRTRRRRRNRRHDRPPRTRTRRNLHVAPMEQTRMAGTWFRGNPSRARSSRRTSRRIPPAPRAARAPNRGVGGPAAGSGRKANLTPSEPSAPPPVGGSVAIEPPGG